MSDARPSKKVMSSPTRYRPLKVIAIPRKVEVKSVGTQTDDSDKKGYAGQIHALMSDFYKKENDALVRENEEMARSQLELEHSNQRLYDMVDEGLQDLRHSRRQLENANEWSEHNWERIQTLIEAIESFMALVDGYTRSMLYDEISRSCRRHGVDFRELLEDPDETESDVEQVMHLFEEE